VNKRGPGPVTRNSTSDVEFPNLILRSTLSSIWDAEFPNLFLRRFRASGSPFYAWLTIDHCIRHTKPLPDWVMAYLGECAGRVMSVHYEERRRLCDRMIPTRYTEGRRLSGKAKQARDIRKTLQSVFGFPKKKSGPGSLFDPDAEAHIWTQKVVFALHFAGRLDQRDDPHTARDNACNDVFGKDGPDDRTLQRYLREVFGVVNLPSTIEAWKPVTNCYRVMLWKALRETFDPLTNR
jgi:hypothetical protein